LVKFRVSIHIYYNKYKFTHKHSYIKYNSKNKTYKLNDLYAENKKINRTVYLITYFDVNNIYIGNINKKEEGETIKAIRNILVY